MGIQNVCNNESIKLCLSKRFLVNKDLIINSGTAEVDIALLENKQLIELHKENTSNNFLVGDVYLGKVKKVISGLNAAFVDIGYEKDAFLHYLDLGPQIRSLNKFTKLALTGKKSQLTMGKFQMEKDIEKTGKISGVLTNGLQILVQIAKEPISSKGPRISSEISFAGRYLVLVPFSSRISISQKIKNVEERNRLKRLLQSIKPNNFGVIIRTVAENRMVADLVNDMNDLVRKWDLLTTKLCESKPPAKIVQEMDRTTTILRDLLNESFSNIYINDHDLYDDLKSYIGTIAPDKKNIVKYYKGKAPIFEHFSVDKQIKNSFGKKVAFKNGAYLIIEHTEAMHVVDVNSGHRLNKDNDQETNALNVNLEAAIEIARQLRLRDMGGIVVVDFIDMQEGTNRRKLFEKMKDVMSTDKAKHTILPPSKFGLIQITRQRVRPEMNVEIHEKCPSCNGSGKIKSGMFIVDEIGNNIRYLLLEQNEKNIKLSVHPYLYAYLTGGWFSVQMKWFMKFKKWIKISKSNNHHVLEYRFFNKKDDEIKI